MRTLRSGMPTSRARSLPNAGEDEAASTRWAEVLRGGASPEALQSEILASENPDRAVRLLGSLVGKDAVPLLTMLAHVDPSAIAVAAVDALGEVRDPSAATALEAVAHSTQDKAIQKAARRALYRLASQGIKPGSVTPPVPTTFISREATLYRAIASAFDGNGTRALWIAADRPLGGIYMVALEINDVRGLTDCVGRDTTRKRFAEQERSMREKDLVAWVELPIPYARQLVQEAVSLARESGSGVPASYALWADTIGEPPAPFERALVYDEINPVEVRLHPTLENETPLLFEQPEVEPWFFPPERVRKYLLQLMQPASSRLLITPESDAERQQRIFREAAKELLPPNALHGLRRRLEETAYIFLRSDRAADARRAVAAAAT